jgi:DNA-binding XRE family transcriptional regulator
MNSGVRLAKERNRLGLTQDDTYPRLNVSRSAYVRWESGNPIPSDKLALLHKNSFDVNFIITGSLSEDKENVQITELKSKLKKEMSRNAYIACTGKSIKDIGFDAINEMLFQIATDKKGKSLKSIDVSDIEKYTDELIKNEK